MCLLITTYVFLFIAYFQTVGVFLLGTHYTIYGLDGIGIDRAKFNGRVMQAAAEIVFLLLLVLVAKGYTVSHQM